MEQRVILLFDVDCFALQVWAEECDIDPFEIEQYPYATAFDGIVTSVNHLAILRGVERRLTVGEALMRCRNLRVLGYPTKFGKYDTLVPRRATEDIYELISERLTEALNTENDIIIEKVSSDEFYVDLTEEIHDVLENSEEYFSLQNPRFVHRMLELRNSQKLTIETTQRSFDLRDVVNFPTRDFMSPHLLAGAFFAAKVIRTIKHQLNFTMSAGVGPNKLLAKIACTRGKPNGLNVLTKRSWLRIRWEIPLKDIPGLGGEIGNQLRISHNIKTAEDFRVLRYGFLYDMDITREHYQSIRRKCAWGADSDPVKPKFLSSYLTCGRRINISVTQPLFLDHQFRLHLLQRLFEMGQHFIHDSNRHNRFAKTLILKVTLTGIMFISEACWKQKGKIQFSKRRMKSLVRWLQNTHEFDKNPWNETIVRFGESLRVNKYLDDLKVKEITVIAKF